MKNKKELELKRYTTGKNTVFIIYEIIEKLDDNLVYHSGKYEYKKLDYNKNTVENYGGLYGKQDILDIMAKLEQMEREHKEQETNK